MINQSNARTKNGLAPSSKCPCGSGLSRTRCCELNLATLGAPEANRHLVPLEERAIHARRTGAGEAAERLALDVLELAPGRVRALTVLYEIRKAQNKRPAAEALIRRIVALEPNNFWATSEIRPYDFTRRAAPPSIRRVMRRRRRA